MRAVGLSPGCLEVGSMVGGASVGGRGCGVCLHGLGQRTATAIGYLVDNGTGQGAAVPAENCPDGVLARQMTLRGQITLR